MVSRSLFLLQLQLSNCSRLQAFYFADALQMEVRLWLLSTFLHTRLSFSFRHRVKVKGPLARPISVFNTTLPVRKLSSQWGSTKQHRRVKIIGVDWLKMGDPKTEAILAPLREKVKEQVHCCFVFYLKPDH